MAKRCIKIALNGSLFNSGEISDFSALTNADGITRIYSGGSLPAWVSSLGDIFFDQATNVTWTSETGTQYKNNYTDWDHYNSHEYYFKATGYPDGYRRTVYTANWVRSFVAFVVDDDIQDAWILEITWYNQSAYLIDQIHISDLYYYVGNEYIPVIPITSNGGGATHIAKVTGQLSSLSNNLSDILMVSGGGGGGLLVGDTDYSGKEAGGISGSGDNSADQSTGNAFGQGESGMNVSGGGSGLYGGYKGTSSKSGGAGSGYIGNSLISNKKMVGYNVPTSSAESTKTESVEDASESPVSGKPKIGNGYAKIKFIKETPVPPSNYIAWLDPEFGVNNLVISKPLQATNVKVVEDYYVADTSSSWSSFIVIPIGMPFTSDIDLIIDLDVYVGNEDNENNTDYGFELYFNLSRNNSRVLGMTMRNSRWASGANINYDIWGNTELHGISSVFDNTNNNYKWANLKVVLGFRSGQWVSSKSYIDDTLFQEYTYSGKNMGSNNIDNIETALPANACTYRIKSYKVYTQTPS